jgi:hypothetical protein
MRTSNKILLALLIVPMVILSIIHAAIFTQYKSGHYITMKDFRDTRFEKQSFKNLPFIVLSGLDNVNIYPSDTLKLEIEKSERRSLKYKLQGDSLIIKGDSIINNPDGIKENLHNPQEVNLYLPNTEYIKVTNCEIQIEPVKDSSQAKSYVFYLNSSSRLSISNNNLQDSSKKYFNKLLINANGNSFVDLSGYLNLHELQLKLSNGSQFDDQNSFINTLDINADKKSTIKLTGENLRKSTIVKEQ